MGWFWGLGQRAAKPMPKKATSDSRPELRLTVRFEEGDEGEFLIPACGGSCGGVPFRWNIDWGDGARGCASGVSSAWGGDVSSGDLVHSYAVPGTYEIALSPIEQVGETAGDAPGWLQAFGYPDGGLLRVGEMGLRPPQGVDKLIEVDGILDDRAINFELEGACASMFTNCKNITMGPSFTISSHKERAGDFFCFKMFAWDNGPTFAMGESFQLPRNLRTVGKAFCCKMFMCCNAPSFSMNDVFTIPQNITSAGSSFCQEMFEEHGLGLTMGKAFNLPQGLVTVEDNFCADMFLTSGGDGYRFEMNEIFNLPQHISGYVGNGFCSGMFSWNRGPNFSMNNKFNIPTGITSAGDEFCCKMFAGCSGARFSMNDIFNLPENFTWAGESCCAWMFKQCNGKRFKLNEKFDYPVGLTGARLLAYEMFSECRWDALNLNIQDIVSRNPHLQIWRQPI